MVVIGDQRNDVVYLVLFIYCNNFLVFLIIVICHGATAHVCTIHFRTYQYN